MSPARRGARELAGRLVACVEDLRRRVDALRFAPPVACVYDPLDYARGPVEEYLRRFARPTCETLFLGMNPGPYGMVQTGIPFGEVATVREWLEIRAAVQRPRGEHPQRPIEGLACRRSEVSGARLWGFFRDRFGTPEHFFERHFVWNYCPLAFLAESGRNLTPDKLPAAEREPLLAACDEALRAFVAELAPRNVVGIGRFARLRAERALGRCDLVISELLHPSPASPTANRGWARQAAAQLAAAGILAAAPHPADDRIRGK